MADLTTTTIGELPAIVSLSDGTLIPAEQGGNAGSISVETLREHVFGGYRLIEWTDTTPSTAGTEYRADTGADNNGNAYCIGLCVYNVTNGVWYQMNDVAVMNGQTLRFTISYDALAGQPFHALIMTK